MDTIQISIKANEGQQEMLISLLNDFDALGYEQTESHLIAFFPLDYNRFAVEKIIYGYEFETSIVIEKNWNQEWENNFQPVQIENFCCIRAHFHEPAKNVKYDLVITPKMSFGTGHHATTYMMIEQMSDIVFTNKKVLDFGTGTGVLAILAEKMGALSIYAIDHDEWSINNAAENLVMNHCNRVSLEQTSILPKESFDIILANINRNVILENINEMKQSLMKSGFLLMSGLLAEDEPTIMKTCNLLKLQKLKQTSRNGWISILFLT